MEEKDIKKEEKTGSKNRSAAIMKITLSAVFVSIFIALAFGAGFMTARLSLNEDIEKIDYILNMYRKYYYDEKDDVVKIFADALLDDYSDYLSREEYAAMNASYAGSRYGIGCTVGQVAKEGGEYDLIVLDVFGNSPCQSAGLKEGDKLVSVAKDRSGEVFAVSSLGEYSAILNEIDDGVDFDLNVLRDQVPVSITVSKRDYKQTFVKYYDGLGEYGFFDVGGRIGFGRLSDNSLYPLGEEDGDVAVIRYRSFSGSGGGINGSVGQFEYAMQKFKEDGKKDIIIDLRGNGGGLIDIMDGVARHFINAEKGKSVKTIVSRDKNGKEEYYYSSGSLYHDYGFENIVILADRDTASASEAFIGAVLDYDEDGIVKVVVSGGRTYGKGIMQNTFSRPIGDAIRLTTAKLFWPKSGKCIHGAGITTATDPRVVNESENGAAFYDALSLCR